MLFKELKVGLPVYYFDRKNIIAITGKVTMNPSMPHADGKMSWQQLVVDVPVQLGDKITSFVLPDNQDTAYPDGAVVSTNRDVALYLSNCSYHRCCYSKSVCLTAPYIRRRPHYIIARGKSYRVCSSSCKCYWE